MTSCHQMCSVFETFEKSHPMFNLPVSGFGKKGVGVGGEQVDTATTRPLTHTVPV